MEIVVQLIDSFEVEADALVYAGTTTGTMDDETGEMILEYVGEELLEETLDTAPIAVGAATMIGVEGLKVEYLIYSPVRVEPTDRVTVENVRRCTRAALVAACARGIVSLVLPAINPPVDDMSMPEAARAMIDELRGYRTDHDLTVHLVSEDDEVVDSLNRVLENVR